MINEETVEAFNTRLTTNINELSKLTPIQKDRVKVHGSNAETLLKDKHLALFIHQYKFELADALANILGHTEVDNNMRIAIANRFSAIDDFIAMLQKAAYIKNRIVSSQTQPDANMKGNE